MKRIFCWFLANQSKSFSYSIFFCIKSLFGDSFYFKIDYKRNITRTENSFSKPVAKKKFLKISTLTSHVKHSSLCNFRSFAVKYHSFIPKIFIKYCFLYYFKLNRKSFDILFKNKNHSCSPRLVR